MSDPSSPLPATPAPPPGADLPAPSSHLPHDGANGEKVFQTSYEGALRAAGFQVRVVPNQGTGAAMSRIQAARRLFPRMWFDKKCQPGLDAVGWYHEKRDPERNIGLGPNHDWASHAADAFGMGAVIYEEPQGTTIAKHVQRKII